MAEFFGGIQRGLGFILNAIYEVIPSYGVAIILLTILVSVVLIPLNLKQIRVMTAQTNLQPEVQRLRAKHKGDRQKMNEELMKLYQEHGVNPLGGCLPLLMQAPVFIALFTVLRASIPIAATTTATLDPGAFSAAEIRGTVCRPTAPPTATRELTVLCTTDKGRTSQFTLKDFRHPETGNPTDPSLVSICKPVKKGQGLELGCSTALGTGHLPQSGDLFKDVNADEAKFLGMHLACSATQSNSRTSIRQCTAEEDDAGGVNVVPYYALIALFIFATWFQTKQMARSSAGQAAQQQQMMARIMPIFLGFVSLSIPAGVNVYWATSTLWRIGQQWVFLKKQIVGGPRPDGGDDSGDGAKPKGSKGPGGKPSQKGPQGKGKRP